MRFTFARFVLATIAAAFLAQSAHAQSPGGFGGGGRKHQQTSQKPAEQKTKVDEQAYKNALKKLPDKPYDPWHGTR